MLVSREPLAAYPTGIRQTIVKMKAIVAKTMILPEVVTMARNVAIECPSLERPCYILKVFRWNSMVEHGGHLTYFPDPSVFDLSTQRLVSPEEVLVEFEKRGFYTGNCATTSLMKAAMLAALAVPARFVVIATPKGKGVYNHILTEGFNGATWTAMDDLTAYPNPASTVQPPLAWRV